MSSSFKADLLVIDDMPDNLRLLVGLLTEQGYKVRPLTSGRSALSAAQAMPPDLILLDVNMPEMNGYQVCQQLKQLELTRDIPVIFLSALNDVFDKVRGFTVGAVDYITKPFAAEEVVARIETHLDIRRLQQQLQQKNRDLEQTLHELKTTQEQLIQSEKLAALGGLVANVAHELNSPLGAIRSATDNITTGLAQTLETFPEFLLSLTDEQRHLFLALLKHSIQSLPSLPHWSSREKRQAKRSLTQQLATAAIAPADILADLLVDLGLADQVQPFWSLLQADHNQRFLEQAYQLLSLQKSAQTIDIATTRASRVVTALKTYVYQGPADQSAQLDLLESIETALTLYYNQIKHGVEVIRDYGEPPPSLQVANDLNQVWTNLIHNALQAMNYRGTLTIAIAQPPQQVQVCITDTGTGIDPTMIDRIFEPFFTTKPRGEGSGLGLSIVKKLVARQNGQIDVESRPGQTTVMVRLPIAPEPVPVP